MKKVFLIVFFLFLPSPANAGDGRIKIYFKNSTSEVVRIWIAPKKVAPCFQSFVSESWLFCLADPEAWSSRKRGMRERYKTSLPDKIPLEDLTILPGLTDPIFFKKGQPLFFCFNVAGGLLVRNQCMIASFHRTDIPPYGYLLFTVVGSGMNPNHPVPYPNSHFSIIEGRKK